MSHHVQPLTVEPGTKVRLADYDARYVDNEWTKESAGVQVANNIAAIADLAYRLYAENRRSLLIVLQGVDTAGKDGTIRCVMTGINPQMCQVMSFKEPSVEELAHDFLWRIHQHVPRRGNIGIFNRSHYEDVLIVRVHELVPKAEWRSRYERINEFERLLSDSGVTVLKLYLHISREEQTKRLRARLHNPKKRWKFSRADLAERELWDEYQRAYDDALTKCNTKHAAWHIVPADCKWYRNLVVSQLVREALEQMDPQIPPAEEGLDEIVIE